MFHIISAIALLLLVTTPGSGAEQTPRPRHTSLIPDDSSTEVIWQLDFASPSPSARTVLADHGFVFEEEMADDGAIELLLEGDRLLLRTSAPAFGLAAKRDLPPGTANWLVIEWGVDRFPKTANWQRGIRREAIMIYLFFGQPQPADRFFLPRSPYFIGHFLGRHEQLRQPFIGASYRQTGRYICLANPQPGQLVSTAFHFTEAFRHWFDNETVPPVTGIAIAMDTSGLPDGFSSAFIKRIALVHNPEEG